MEMYQYRNAARRRHTEGASQPTKQPTNQKSGSSILREPTNQPTNQPEKWQQHTEGANQPTNPLNRRTLSMSEPMAAAPLPAELTVRNTPLLPPPVVMAPPVEEGAAAPAWRYRSSRGCSTAPSSGPLEEDERWARP